MTTTEPPPPPPTTPDEDTLAWWQRILRDPQRTRLSDELQVAKLRLQNRRAGIPPTADRAEHELAERVSQALLTAQVHLDRLDVDGGFAHLLFARELEFGLLPEEELDARVIELRAEAKDKKYIPWRNQAIEAVLTPLDPPDPAARVTDPAKRRAIAAQAARIAMEGSSNGYRRLTILRRHQTILLLIGAALLVVATVLTVVNTGEFGDVDAWWVGMVSVLLGALGGVTSALQRSTSSAAGRIPERLTSYVVSLSRPMLGAVAGLIAYLGQRVIIDDNGAAKVGAILVASFAAGFTERLLPVTREESTANPPPTGPPAT